MNNEPLGRDLAAALDSLGRRVAEKVQQGEVAPAPEQQEPKPPAKIVRLPLWDDDKRGTPNCFLRSALFAAIYGNATRKYVKDALLAAQGDVSVRYTGEQLSQSDLDLVMAALHFARAHPLGNVCHFKGYAFLKILGRSDSKPNYLWLDSTIDRLIASLVKIRIGQRVYSGSILSSSTRDEASDVYKLVFDPDFVKLFGASDWTAVDWTTRQKLTRSPLAQWIYDYAVSHVGTKIKLETLQQLSGRESDTPKRFNEAVKRAKEMLEKAAAVAMEIDAAGLVTLSHKLSPAQLRHVARKGRKKRSG
jgi:TrfA protein